jgi:hypothetical protein
MSNTPVLCGLLLGRSLCPEYWTPRVLPRSSLLLRADPRGPQRLNRGFGPAPLPSSPP